VGVDVVVHTAGRAHIMSDTAGDPLSQYRKVNVEGTLNLARQAAVAKVKRFVFISSIKVNGESTLPGKPFTVNDQPRPEDPYGISKWEAEVGLNRLVKETGMEVVIIRPSLVYGPGVKANFLRMMRWINDGVPLPLARIDNKRSLVAIDNLVDLIITCIDHPAAANQVFLAGDGDDLSTSELAKCIGKALGKPARLFLFPVSLLSLAAWLLGKKNVVQRLTGSLQVDISRAGELLAWKPPFTLEQGLRRTADDFRQQSAGS
jgi:nucleoside-diphosphate-sugar epimerase